MSATPAALLAPFEADAEACPRAEAPRNFILLAEDDDVIAELVAHILRRRGRFVLRARDAAEAERRFMAKADRIALLIVDCRLPDAHGGALGQKLRRVVPGLPVLFTSGREQSALAELLADGGRTEFLRKPFFPADLDRQVTALLSTIA